MEIIPNKTHEMQFALPAGAAGNGAGVSVVETHNGRGIGYLLMEQVSLGKTLTRMVQRVNHWVSFYTTLLSCGQVEKHCTRR